MSNRDYFHGYLNVSFLPEEKFEIDQGTPKPPHKFTQNIS